MISVRSWWRRGRAYMAVALTLLLTITQAWLPAPALAAIAPAALEATLHPGESVHEVKTVTVPQIIPKADILFSLDLTGSMGGVLGTAKTKAIAIMNQLDGLISDAHYGVVSHMDYPGYYNSYGYSAPYGDAPGDYPYKLNQAVTADRAAVSAAINALSLNNGSDTPEDYARILYESYSDPATGWRDGARHILIMFGDSLPHDNNLNEGVPGKSGIYSTGGDPGRDGYMFNADDIDLQQALAQMTAHGVILYNVWSNAYEMSYWKHWAGLTGGDALMLGNASDLPAAIQAAIEKSAAKVHKLSLKATPGFESWVAASPTAYTELDTPATVTFDLDITVPADTPPGDYAFTISAIGDGADYGDQSVVIHVKPLDTTPPQTSYSYDGLTGLAGWWRSLVKTTLSAVDDISGVAATYFNLDWTGETLYSAPFDVYGDGYHAFSYYSVDNAGNYEPERWVKLRIDTEPPVAAIWTAGTAGLNGWYISPVKGNVSATDKLSGVADIFYDTYFVAGGPGPVAAYTEPFTMANEGMQAIQALATDQAGNKSATVTEFVNIDLTPPEIAIGALNGEYTAGDSLTVDFKAADKVSGLAWVKGDLNGSPIDPGTVITPVAGIYTLTVTAQNMAGLETQSVVSFKVNVPATVRAHPRTLNLDSKSDTLMVQVDLPEPFNVADIDCKAIRLNSQVPADCDHAGNPDGGGRGRSFFFSRQDVEAIALAGDWNVVITGALVDGVPFKGMDTIRVIRH